MKIAIIGMGVVGKGMKKLLEKRFEIVPFDIGGDKEGVNTCDLAIICVPTNELPGGSCDTSIVEEVLGWVETPLILIKSTVPPRFTTRMRLKTGKAINFSPEYMGESKYFTPFWKYPDPQMAESHTFVIVGGEEADEILDVFMKVMSVDTKYIACSPEEAELAKYMENCFFATKVTFCNEFADIAALNGVDYNKLRELWLLDSRINPNHTLVFKDDRGYGGKCYPKDIAGIVSATERLGYEPTLLKAVIATNKKIRG